MSYIDFPEPKNVDAAGTGAGPRDDLMTVVAIAALAACTSDLAHEVLGHGSACLASGGHISLLNNAFFTCTTSGRFIALAGPTGNLIVGLLAFTALGAISPRRTILRLYALLVMAFSLFWEAGYLIEAMLIDSGDSVYAWREWMDRETPVVRITLAGAGVLAYLAFWRMLRFRASFLASTAGRARNVLRPAWCAGVTLMIASAALYAPDRSGAMRDATLSIAASFPLLFTAPRPVPESETMPLIRQDFRVMALGAIAALVFAGTLGRGVY